MCHSTICTTHSLAVKMKPALMIFCLVLIVKGEPLSVCKISQDKYEDVEQARTLMKDLNIAMEKVFNKLDTCLEGPNCVVPRNCDEVLKFGGKSSGVYTINPDGGEAFQVYCDQKTNGGGWTVFQRRQDGTVGFYRGWDNYKNGFGDLKGEFWLGLDKIHRLTNKTCNRLRVDLGDHEGNSRYAEYDYFAVSDERKNYTLELGKYNGTAGDSLSFHRGYPFSTKDRDHDTWYSKSCAVLRKAAWWFRHCMHSDLNGLYFKTSSVPFAEGVNWVDWRGDHYSLKKADMKLRPT